HGDNGKIIVPVLGEDIYYPDECRDNLGFLELEGKSIILRENVGSIPSIPNRMTFSVKPLFRNISITPSR
ncbi:MAG: hypothetical protein J6J05_08445, partial [Peptococcaceae bacterium]|nr:hypothetical protein [Peptococcaceae bacterium]